MKARFVIMALGTTTRAKLPGIPGIESFEGHSFHTNRWDYDYTGGDTDGGMTGLADKRVAVIGTGATAIQCVPRLAEGRRPPLRVPAHAVHGRLARQQAHRSRSGAPRWSRAGNAAGGELHDPSRG